MADPRTFQVGDWVQASHARRTANGGVFARRTGNSPGRIVTVVGGGAEYQVVFLLTDPQLQDPRDPDGLDIWWLGENDVLPAAAPSEEELLPWLLHQLTA